MATRSLRKRGPVDYSDKIKKKDRYHYVKKSKDKGSKRKKAQENAGHKKKKSVEKPAPSVAKHDKENVKAVMMEVSKKKEAATQKLKKPAAKKTTKKTKRKPLGDIKKTNQNNRPGPDPEDSSTDIELPVQEPIREAKSSLASISDAPRRKVTRKIVSREIHVPASNGTVPSDVYDKVFERCKTLREENKALHKRLSAKLEKTLSHNLVAKLQKKIEELESGLKKKNQEVKSLKEQAKQMTADHKSSRSEFIKREIELKSVVDTYKVLTSTRVQSKEPGVFSCRSINPEHRRVMDYDLVVGSEEVEFLPSEECEDYPEMFQEEIAFEIAQTPKFLQLILKSLHEQEE